MKMILYVAALGIGSSSILVNMIVYVAEFSSEGSVIIFPPRLGCII